MNAEARQVLAELELLAGGSTQSWNSSGGGESDAVMPSGEPRPLYLQWRERLQTASAEDLPALVQAARDALNEFKRRQAPATASVSLDALIVDKAGQGWDADAVAQHFGVAPAFVRRLWEKAGLDPLTGGKRKASEMSTKERRRHVASLHARGWTQVQIAAHLGCKQYTVCRDLQAR